MAGLGLGTTFTGMLSHLTSSVTGEHASDLSGLFNTITRAGGVLGAAAFGTAYLALARDHQPVHSFATINLALAVTALAAAVLAGLSVWRRPPSRGGTARRPGGYGRWPRDDRRSRSRSPMSR